VTSTGYLLRNVKFYKTAIIIMVPTLLCVCVCGGGGHQRELNRDWDSRKALDRVLGSGK